MTFNAFNIRVGTIITGDSNSGVTTESHSFSIVITNIRIGIDGKPTFDFVLHTERRGFSCDISNISRTSGDLNFLCHCKNVQIHN